ncbi:hypothetical protein LZ198_30955 [Myxococcus sp. K15C18031901]|uniref:hypothetical protein n=1 Tax=Myxococcus dinghuensis TaxID=2906761 RepID=UPI0020A76DE1|nr:hypothetical protein [Myxococcus dinghuensis]MCP3103310.1 hypothetical protein [Myxococcus dinghuensis]
MDATRVGRVRSPMKKARTAVPVGTVADRDRTPIRRPPLPLPVERYALVAWVLGRERAEALVDGLGERDAERAKAHLRQLAALPSSLRQAKVTAEFGERADAAARLKTLMDEVPEPLRKEVFRRLPPFHRTLFPERRVEAADPLSPPALAVLAERLIREATR